MGISQGNAFLLSFGVLSSNSIDLTTTTFFTPTQVQIMLSTNNVIIMANNDITILSSFTYTGTNTLTLTSMGTFNANPLGVTVPNTPLTISVASVTINANGDIGSAANPFSFTSTGTITLNAGTNNIYLADATDISSYLAATYTARSLSLTQSSGDIAITSAISLPSTDLTLIATNGVITTNLTSVAITAGNLTLNANGDIGSAANPFILDVSGSLVLNAGTNAVFLEHGSDVSVYLPLSGMVGSLSLTQGSGDIAITSAISLASANLTLTATNGAITTDLTSVAITAGNLTLNANGDIGSAANPFILDVSGSFVLNAGTNGVYLAHQSDALSYLSADITANLFSLAQVTGDLNIGFPLNLPLTAITLIAQSGDVIIGDNINVLSLSLQAQGAVTTTSSNNRIATTSLEIVAMDGDIGSSAERIHISTGLREVNFDYLRLYTARADGAIFIRRDLNASGSSHTDVVQQIERNLLSTEENTFAITVFSDGSGDFDETTDFSSDFNQTVAQTSNINTVNEGFLPDILNSILAFFGDDCANDDTDLALVSDIVQAQCD